MPIDYEIFHDRRLVAARGRGVFTHQDVVGYQQDVWSRHDVAGFDEVIDMTAVERIDLPSADAVRQLAALSASMDDPEALSKFAIVAPQDIAFGLGRMYEAHRAMNPRSAKEVGVFRTMAEALAWLGRMPADLA